MAQSVVNEIAGLTVTAQALALISHTTRDPSEMGCAAQRSASPSRSQSTDRANDKAGQEHSERHRARQRHALTALVLVPPPLANDQRFLHVLREQWQRVVHQPADQRLLGEVQVILRGSRLGEDNLALRDRLLALFQGCSGLR